MKRVAHGVPVDPETNLLKFSMQEWFSWSCLRCVFSVNLGTYAV